MMERMVLMGYVCLVVMVQATMCRAQTDELKKYEVAAVFSSISKPDFSGTTTEAGGGGRFTFNLNRSIALEAEGNLFPHRCFSCTPETQGRLAEFLAGVKAGKRFEGFGVFLKARPGFASFSRGGGRTIFATGSPGTFPFLFDGPSRKTNFAMDLGVAVEIYHSKRIFTRFDVGDTLIRYTDRSFTVFNFDPSTGAVIPLSLRLPNKTRHNFQFQASVGFRF